MCGHFLSLRVLGQGWRPAGDWRARVNIHVAVCTDCGCAHDSNELYDIYLDWRPATYLYLSWFTPGKAVRYIVLMWIDVD